MARALDGDPAVLAVSLDPRAAQVIARYDGARADERTLWARTCGALAPRTTAPAWLLHLPKLARLLAA